GRQRHTKVVFLLMPESREFQSWYPPEARKEIDAFLMHLSREYDLPIVDARSWVGEEAFFDSHHLTFVGAQEFSQRFGREILAPLLQGRLKGGIWTGQPGSPVQNAPPPSLTPAACKRPAVGF